MKTLDIRVLVDDDTDAAKLTAGLVSGPTPYSPNERTSVYGAVELDKDGVPVPHMPTRPHVDWDGWPRETARYSMGMPCDPELNKMATYWQTVKVYEHNGQTSMIVAAASMVIRDAEPGTARVTSDDGRTVYVSDGDWESSGGTWACAARVERTEGGT